MVRTALIVEDEVGSWFAQHVIFRLTSSGRAKVSHIAHYARNGEPLPPRSLENSFANRVFALAIFAGPVDASRGPIDDGDLGRIFKVLVGEEASTLERHAQEVKVFGRDDGTVDQRRLIVHCLDSFSN